MSGRSGTATRIRVAAQMVARPTARAVLATSGINTLISFLGSLGGVILARSLGPTDRGNLVTVLQWPAVLGVLASLGITTATCYLVSRSRHKASRITATAALCGIAAGAIVAMLGAFVVAPLVSKQSAVQIGLSVVFFATPAFIVGGVLVSALQALDLRGWNEARVAQPSAYLALTALLWLTGRMSLGAAVSAYVVSVLLQVLVAAVLTHRRLYGPRQPSWEHARALYSYGPKVTLSSLPQIVNVQLDILLLSVFPGVTPARLGNYAVAVSMVTLALPIAVAAGSVAFPLVAGTTSEITRRRVERKSVAFSLIAATGGMVIVSLAAPFVTPLIFGEGYGSAVRCVWLLAPGTVCLAAAQVVGDILRGRNCPLQVSVAQGVGAICTVLGLIVLVPLHGIFGAAMISSVAYGTVLIVLLRCLRGVRLREASERLS